VNAREEALAARVDTLDDWRRELVLA